MTPTFFRFPFLAAGTVPRPFSRRRQQAFSLVEVTLALGISAFALMAVLGVMPTAISTARQSFDQNRASAIANTLFASIRSQAFSNVCYKDDQFAEDGATPLGKDIGLDLNTLTPASAPVKFCASFLDPSLNGSVTNSGFGEQRRLAFTESSDAQRAAANYSVTLHFNNAPAGVLASNTGTRAEANQIEVVISPLSQPATKYSFVSTVANRF